jgi:hypothetical protein
MEEKRTFQWSPEAEAAFWALKELWGTAPILGYPRPVEKFIVDKDVGNVRVGGVLSQVQDGQDSVVGYYSQDPIEGREQLLRDTTGVTRYCEDVGTLPQILL